MERKSEKHISGVRCDVKNCAYHDGELYCTAQHIAIGPGTAKSASETVCGTFEKRES
ncbi:MAG: DUF1540 domain-containing protein [Clostridia bacterium]|nr:DUF1540 domain-containing protein [Clostridia bacterium]